MQNTDRQLLGDTTSSQCYAERVLKEEQRLGLAESEAAERRRTRRAAKDKGARAAELQRIEAELRQEQCVAGKLLVTHIRVEFAPLPRLLVRGTVVRDTCVPLACCCVPLACCFPVSRSPHPGSRTPAWKGRWPTCAGWQVREAGRFAYCRRRRRRR